MGKPEEEQEAQEAEVEADQFSCVVDSVAIYIVVLTILGYLILYCNLVAGDSRRHERHGQKIFLCRCGMCLYEERMGGRYFRDGVNDPNWGHCPLGT
jgi:hypothetical protein